MDRILDDNHLDLDMNWQRIFFRQMLLGVLHCHTLGVAHLDLKLENFVLMQDGTTVKLIDFGHSIRVIDAAGQLQLVNACAARQLTMRRKST